MKIKGKTVVFTGKFASMTRSEAETRARELGAEVTTAVRAGVDFLISASTTTAKARAAARLGVKVLSEEQWMKIADLKEAGPLDGKSKPSPEGKASSPSRRTAASARSTVGKDAETFSLMPRKARADYLVLLQVVSDMLDEYHFDRSSVAGEGSGEIIKGVGAPAARRSKLRVGLSALVSRIQQAGLKQLDPDADLLATDERALLMREEPLILRYALELLTWNAEGGFSVRGDAAKAIVGEEGRNIPTRITKRLLEALQAAESAGSLFS